MSFLSDYLARRREILEAQTTKHEEEQASPEALLEALNTNTGNTADLIGKQSKDAETQNRAVVGGLETISKVLESSKPAAAKVDVSIERASNLEQTSTVITNKALASIADSLKELVASNKLVEKHLRPDLNSTDDTYQKRKDDAAAAVGKEKEAKPSSSGTGLGGVLLDMAYNALTKKPGTPTSGKPVPSGTGTPTVGRTRTRGGVTRTIGTITPSTTIPTAPVQGRVGKFLSSTRQVLGNVGTKVSETATRLAPKMQEFAGKAWDATKGAASKAGTATVEAVERGAPKVAEALSKAKAAVEPTVTKAGTLLSKGAEKALESTKGAATGVAEGAAQGGKGFLSSAGKWVGRLATPVAVGLSGLEAYGTEKDDKLSRDQKNVKHGGTAGGLLGAIGGAAATGAIAGSVVPGLGTLGGLVVGGLGGAAGYYLGGKAGEAGVEGYQAVRGPKDPALVGAAQQKALDNNVIAGTLGAATPAVVNALAPNTAHPTNLPAVVGAAQSQSAPPEAVKAALGASIAMAISPIAKDSQDALNTKLVPALNETGKSVTDGATTIQKSNETLAASFTKTLSDWSDKFTDMLGGVKNMAGRAYDGAKSAVGGAVSATGGAIGGGAQAAGSAIERMTAGTRFAGVGKTVGGGLSKAGESVAMTAGDVDYNLKKGSSSALELAKGFQGTTTLKGLSEAQTKAYAGDVMKTESGGKLGITNQYGYLGQYQFGADALSDQGLVDKDKMTAAKAAAKASGQSWYAPDHKGAHEAFLKDKSNWKIEGGQDAFLQNKQLQDDTFGKYTNANIEAGYKKDKSGKSALTETSTPAEIAGYAKAAHLVGAGAANDLYKSGIEKTDANKTKASDYAKQGATAVTELAAQLGPTKISQTPTTLASAEPIVGSLAPGAITKSATSIKPTFAKPSVASVEQVAAVEQVAPVAKAKPTTENMKLASSAIDDIPNTTAGWFAKTRNVSNPTATIGIRGLPMDQVAAMNPDIDPMTGELKAKPASKAQKMQEKADRIARWEADHPEDIGMFPGEGQGLPTDTGAKPVMPLGERVISQSGIRVSEAAAPPTGAKASNRYSGQPTYGSTPPAKAPTSFSLDNIGALANSPAASALLSLPEMRPAMQSADLAKAAARGDVGSILSNPAISGMVKNPEALRLAGPILQSLNQPATSSGVPSPSGMPSNVYGSAARSYSGTTSRNSTPSPSATPPIFPSFNPIAETEFVPFEQSKGGYKTFAQTQSAQGFEDFGAEAPSLNVRRESMQRVAANVPAEAPPVTVANQPPPAKGTQSQPPPAPISNAFDTAVPKIDNIPLQISDLGLVLLNIGHI